MAKGAKKDSQSSKKDNLQAKAGSGSVVKAKHRRKRSNPKKVTEKLAEDIRSSNDEFRKLQSKMASEKENQNSMSSDKDEQPSTSKAVPTEEAAVSQERKVEETTQVLACL